jgi:hypothetical protein
MTHESWQQQEFSIAYTTAVASVAGYAVHRVPVDNDGIDVTICGRGSTGTTRSPKLDVQLKTKTGTQPTTFPWPYPLELGNYETLRPSNVLVPRVLVVVAIPKDVNDWLSLTHKQLALRHCGYWISLRDKPATTNATSVTVHLPKAQPFSPAQLDGIMQRIGQGGLP